MLTQPVTLRVDMTSPMLGVSPLTLVQPAADPIVWRPCPVVLPVPSAPPPQLQLDDVHEQLTDLRMVILELGAQIQSLQADLASRTWTARWQRFVVWCTDLWRRVRT